MEYPPPPILPPPRPKSQAYIAIVVTITLAVAIYIAITLTGIKQSLAGSQRNTDNRKEQKIESGTTGSDVASATSRNP